MFDETTRAPERVQRPDLDVLADVNTALWKDAVIRVAERNSVAIEVHDGEVFLLGHTATGSDGRRIDDLVAAVPGVSAVCNDIVADPDLVAQVALALAVDPRTRPYVIHVAAFHGWIRLGGEVATSEARAAAEEIAASAPRVRGVLALPRQLGTGAAEGGEIRRSLQPRLGEPVYAHDGPAGRVAQVVINPRNRLVSHIAVAADFELGTRPVRETFSVPVEALEVVSDGGVFLKEPLSVLAARPTFREADFPAAPLDWRSPFPYAAGTVRWPPA